MAESPKPNLLKINKKKQHSFKFVSNMNAIKS